MIWYKVVTLCVTSVVCASADIFTFQDSFSATDGSVAGPFADFALQDVSLTTPSTPGGEWTVTIHTNYGAGLPGPAGDVIPDFGSYAASDFLICWNGGFYGIVLHSHDGYTAGDLYQAAGFQTTGQVRQDPSSDPAENRDVWLDAGGSLVGTGTVSAAGYGDGVTQALYTVTDMFQAPDGFLSGGDFEIQMSSADCANGYVTGLGSFDGSLPHVPEPGAVWLFATIVLITWWRLRKSRRPGISGRSISLTLMSGSPNRSKLHRPWS
jgi:hypothetical protein